jgi:hypothetical protein
MEKCLDADFIHAGTQGEKNESDFLSECIAGRPMKNSGSNHIL